MDCDKTAVLLTVLVGVVAHQPNVIKITVGQFISGGDFSITGAHIRSTAKAFCNLGIGIDKRSTHFSLPGFQPFQLFHVLGAVVNVLSKVRIGGRGGKTNAAGSRSDLPSLANCTGGRREISCDDTGVDLEFLECINRNFGKLHPRISFLSLEIDIQR